MRFQPRLSIRNVLTVLTVISGFVLSVMAWPALAQGEGTQAADATSQNPAGIGILIFVLGLGSILVVGMIYYSQLRAQTHPQAPEQDDEE